MDLYIAATNDSPEVDFKFSKHTLTMKGEAFPEDASKFYYPIVVALDQYLKNTDKQEINFDFQLTYFNSASTKMLFTIFQLLNKSASTNNRVLLNWHFDEEDDTIKEFGQEIAEDFPMLELYLVETSQA